MLNNFNCMVGVSKTECAVPADRERELGIICDANLSKLNREVASALQTGSQATCVVEVGAYLCGEPEALARLPRDRIFFAIWAVAGAGYVAVAQELHETRDSELEQAGGHVWRNAAPGVKERPTYDGEVVVGARGRGL